MHLVYATFGAISGSAIFFIGATAAGIERGPAVAMIVGITVYIFCVAVAMSARRPG